MMNNKEFSKLLEKRTLDFGVRIIRLSASLPDTAEGTEIRRQIAKSGTSTGANYLPCEIAWGQYVLHLRVAKLERWSVLHRFYREPQAKI